MEKYEFLMRMLIKFHIFGRIKYRKLPSSSILYTCHELPVLHISIRYLLYSELTTQTQISKVDVKQFKTWQIQKN